MCGWFLTPSTWDYFPTAWKENRATAPATFVFSLGDIEDRKLVTAAHRLRRVAVGIVGGRDGARQTILRSFSIRFRSWNGRFRFQAGAEPRQESGRQRPGVAAGGVSWRGGADAPSPPHHPAGPTAGRAPRDDRSAKARRPLRLRPAARQFTGDSRAAKVRRRVSPTLGESGVDWGELSVA